MGYVLWSFFLSTKPTELLKTYKIPNWCFCKKVFNEDHRWGIEKGNQIRVWASNSDLNK